MNETRYPLSWPQGYNRTPKIKRTRAQFGKSETVSNSSGGSWQTKRSLSVWEGVLRTTNELRRFKVADSDIIISTMIPVRLDGIPRSDRAEPADPGVAVYWKNPAGKRQCMAIDRYDRVADNLSAVAATLEALRAIERHGGGAILDRAFQGFAQLQAAGKPWREVLGFPPTMNPVMELVENAFRALAKKCHPDIEGSHERMIKLNRARAEAIEELSR
jgi:hypothetical protein